MRRQVDQATGKSTPGPRTNTKGSRFSRSFKSTNPGRSRKANSARALPLPRTISTDDSRGRQTPWLRTVARNTLVTTYWLCSTPISQTTIHLRRRQPTRRGSECSSATRIADMSDLCKYNACFRSRHPRPIHYTEKWSILRGNTPLRSSQIAVPVTI
jgi:hypothetical protein